MRDAPTLCAPPDTREYLAVLGVITTQSTGWRHSIRRSWLRSPDDGALVTRLVMRGLNASDEIISEADQFGDVVFLPSSTSLNKNRGPLQSTWQWFECASSAWPRASLIGKAEDDVWAHLPGILESLRASAEVGRGTRELYWGMMETYHWNTSIQRPIGYGHVRPHACPLPPKHLAHARHTSTCAALGAAAAPEERLHAAQPRRLGCRPEDTLPERPQRRRRGPRVWEARGSIPVHERADLLHVARRGESCGEGA